MAVVWKEHALQLAKRKQVRFCAHFNTSSIQCGESCHFPNGMMRTSTHRLDHSLYFLSNIKNHITTVLGIQLALLGYYWGVAAMLEWLNHYQKKSISSICFLCVMSWYLSYSYFYRCTYKYVLYDLTFIGYPFDILHFEPSTVYISKVTCGLSRWLWPR